MDPLGLPEILLTVATWVVWIGLIVVIGRAVVGALRGRRDPAVDALRTRLAKGEIDDVEYERLRTTLQRG